MEAPCCAWQFGCHRNLPLRRRLDTAWPTGWRVGPMERTRGPEQSGHGAGGGREVPPTAPPSGPGMRETGGRPALCPLRLLLPYDAPQPWRWRSPACSPGEKTSSTGTESCPQRPARGELRAPVLARAVRGDASCPLKAWVRLGPSAHPGWAWEWGCSGPPAGDVCLVCPPAISPVEEHRGDAVNDLSCLLITRQGIIRLNGNLSFVKANEIYIKEYLGALKFLKQK